MLNYDLRPFIHPNVRETGYEFNSVPLRAPKISNIISILFKLFPWSLSQIQNEHYHRPSSGTKYLDDIPFQKVSKTCASNHQLPFSRLPSNVFCCYCYRLTMKSITVWSQHQGLLKESYWRRRQAAYVHLFLYHPSMLKCCWNYLHFLQGLREIDTSSMRSAKWLKRRSTNEGRDGVGCFALFTPIHPYSFCFTKILLNPSNVLSTLDKLAYQQISKKKLEVSPYFGVISRNLTLKKWDFILSKN